MQHDKHGWFENVLHLKCVRKKHDKDFRFYCLCSF